jgi:hypothetical protein
MPSRADFLGPFCQSVCIKKVSLSGYYGAQKVSLSPCNIEAFVEEKVAYWKGWRVSKEFRNLFEEMKWSNVKD